MSHTPVVGAILEALSHSTPEDTVGSIKVYVGGTTMYLRNAVDLALALAEPLTISKFPSPPPESARCGECGGSGKAGTNPWAVCKSCGGSGRSGGSK